MEKWKKLIPLFLLSVCLICGIFYFIKIEHSKSKSNDTASNDRIEESVEGTTQMNVIEPTDKIEQPNENSLQISDIPGYQGQSSKDDTSINIGGIELPYKVPNTNMVIESIGQYTGSFLEDGSDEPTPNVMSIVVTNNSDELLQYGEIYLKVNNDKEVVFKVTTLPSNTSALVLESSGNVKFNESDKLEYVNSLETTINDYTTMTDKIEIIKEDNKITVKNKTDEDLGTVYVYYKYIQSGGVYLGGITYRSKFENVGPGKSVEVQAMHFSKDTSVVLMADYIK